MMLSEDEIHVELFLELAEDCADGMSAAILSPMMARDFGLADDRIESFVSEEEEISFPAGVRDVHVRVARIVVGLRADRIPAPCLLRLLRPQMFESTASSRSSASKLTHLKWRQISGGGVSEPQMESVGSRT